MTCVNGSTDNGLLTVDDPTPFSEGDTITLEDDAGVWSWVATITGISGYQITFSPVPDPPNDSLANLEICTVDDPGPPVKRWFGPVVPCNCCSEGSCPCSPFLSDSQIELSGVATTRSLENDIDRIQGRTPEVYIYPGHTGGTKEIERVDSPFCWTQVDSTVIIPRDPSASWGGELHTIAPLGFPTTYTIHGFYDFTNIMARVVYNCGDTPTRSLLLNAAYAIRNVKGFGWDEFNPDDYPGWDWSVVAGGSITWRGTATVGTILFTHTVQLTTNSSEDGYYNAYFYISLEAVTNDTTIDLSDAPTCFDPHGILIGVATIT